MPVRNYHYSLRSNTEDHSSQLLWGRGLKSRTSKKLLQSDGCETHFQDVDISAAVEQKGREEGGKYENEAGIFLNDAAIFCGHIVSTVSVWNNGGVMLTWERNLFHCHTVQHKSYIYWRGN